MILRLPTIGACVAAGLSAAPPASAACSLKTQSIPVTMQGLRPRVAAKVTLLSGADGKSPKVWLGAFSSVQIGGDEIKDAKLEIGQTNDDFYDVVIGGDYFATHHLYVANSQGKIYATFSGFPGAPVFMHKPTSSATIDASLGASRALGGLGAGD